MKKLGELQFFVDDKESELTSRFIPGENKLILNPWFDLETAKMVKMPVIDQKNLLTTVVAHELAHFVATLWERESHNPLAQLFLGPEEGEADAWNISKDHLPAARSENCEDYDGSAIWA
jgi:hypothetical protein